MPGLVGIVSLNNDEINPNLIQGMRDAIMHQDWYQADDFVNENMTIAISRVNLGILNKDAQPYLARNGQVKIFLDGQIYKDEAPHPNPFEVIYQLYSKEGQNFAASLNGTFLIIIIDEDEQQVIVANDRRAGKPLFYFNDGCAVYFSPEMKSLLRIPSLNQQVNLTAVTDFLCNGFLMKGHTFIEDIERINGATVLKISSQGVMQHEYWRYEFEKDNRDRGKKYYKETLAHLLRQAVKRRLRNDGTYGILLSGGYDSRGILGFYLDEKANGELHTISWGREENIPDSDCDIARRLAQQLGASHRFYKLTAEEVIGNFSDFVKFSEGLAWYLESHDVFHRIRNQQGIDIILRGDECLGWNRLRVHDDHTMLQSLGLRAFQDIPIYKKVLKSAYYQSFYEYDMETRRQILQRCTAKSLHNRKDFFYFDVRVKYLLSTFNYGKTLALESFTPLLDNDILDFLTILPYKYRLDKGLYRETIIEQFPHLFKEIAQRRNDLEWSVAFKSSPEIQRFVYQQLIEEQSLISEFVDMEKLKRELDAFYATPSNAASKPGLKTQARTAVQKLDKIFPNAYNLAHKSSYILRKRQGRFKDDLPRHHLINRLLVLKVWGDIFLNYPVIEPSNR